MDFEKKADKGMTIHFQGLDSHNLTATFFLKFEF